MRFQARLGPALAGIVLLFLLAFPYFDRFLPANQHEFYLQSLSWIMIYALFCLSLDLLVGVVGLVSLGHAAFYGLGAYLLILFAPSYEAPALLIVLPLILLCVALAALAVGALALRTSGISFIMVTLAIGQMFFYLFNDSKIAGGSDGVYLFVKPTLEIFHLKLLDFENKTHFYYTIFGLLVLSYFGLRMVLAAPFGKVLRGIGINEGRTQALGYHVYAYKLASFVLAACLAGLAGALAAIQYGFVNPSMLGWHMSGMALVTVILGGMGTLVGPIFGAFAVEILRHGLEEITSHWLLLFGALIVGLVLLLPRGLAGLIDRRGDRQ